MNPERVSRFSFDRAPGDESGLVAPLQPAGAQGDAWVAEQRFVHGLLRVMHSRDARTDDARIDAIIARIDMDPRIRHRWAVLATAALVLGLVAWPFVAATGLPEAEAAVMRGAALLADGADRRFSVETEDRGPHAEAQLQSFELIARPGMHFVVDGSLHIGALHFKDMRFGCDGKEFWFQSEGAADTGAVRRSGLLDEAPAILRGIGNVLDLGLLDVHRVVQQLPEQFRLRSEGRSRADDGRTLVHVEATGGPERPGFHLHRADLWCDEATGMIERLQVEADDGFGRVQRLSFVHQGTVAVDTSIYDRPW